MSDQTPIRTFDIVVTQGYDIEEVDRPTGDYVRAEDVATLTARCEALETHKLGLESLMNRAIRRADDAEQRCEVLTAEQDHIQTVGGMIMRERDELIELRTTLVARCQHLEQAVKDLVVKWTGMSGLGNVSGDDTELTLKYCAKELASLLPTKEETQTDENRVSFAAGYSAALDDALKGKP